MAGLPVYALFYGKSSSFLEAVTALVAAAAEGGGIRNDDVELL